MCLVHKPESTCFWHDNELISSCSRSFHGLVMAAIGPWLNGLEKEGDTAGWSFLAFFHVTSALCHMRNYENELSKEGFNPYWTRVPLLIWLNKLKLTVMGSNYQAVLRFDWLAHVSFSCWDLYMSWAGSAGHCSWAFLGLVIPTKMNGFAIGNIHGFL